MIGVISAGGYVPRYRLSVTVLGHVWGSPTAGGERSVANYDEDSLTMACEASLTALGDRRRLPGLDDATLPREVERDGAGHRG